MEWSGEEQEEGEEGEQKGEMGRKRIGGVHDEHGVRPRPALTTEMVEGAKTGWRCGRIVWLEGWRG